MDISIERKRRHQQAEADYERSQDQQQRLEAAAERRELNRRESLRRLTWVDGKLRRDGEREISMAVGGSLLTVEKEPGFEMYEGADRAKRGRVGCFSTRARQRLLNFASGLRTDARPLFLTLTYPSTWPDEWQFWKVHLQTFWKRLRRKYPAACALWKLEPQERGAPHFHLLLWGVPFLPKEWLSQAWFEVVGSGLQEHLSAGTQVDRARSVRGVQAYCGKAYLGKTVATPAQWENVGRWWGVLGRVAAPRAPRAIFRVKVAHAFRFRRLVRKYLASKGRRLKAGDRRRMGTIVLFTQQIAEWARALDWCCGEEIVQRFLDMPLEQTPF